MYMSSLKHNAGCCKNRNLKFVLDCSLDHRQQIQMCKCAHAALTFAIFKIVACHRYSLQRLELQHPEENSRQQLLQNESPVSFPCHSQHTLGTQGSTSAAQDALLCWSERQRRATGQAWTGTVQNIYAHHLPHSFLDRLDLRCTHPRIHCPTAYLSDFSCSLC